ncbi:MAG: hypothetical protein HY319_16545 [Armatimonadetes bacterium]|nr:hypothetical protein [Armatimonadota bacterium]
MGPGEPRDEASGQSFSALGWLVRKVAPTIAASGGSRPSLGAAWSFPPAAIPTPPFPRDHDEFASFLEAQGAGGTLRHQRGIQQTDALPWTRLARVLDGRWWEAALARSFACQVAACVAGQNALNARGMIRGLQVLGQLSMPARLFVQAVAVAVTRRPEAGPAVDQRRLARFLRTRALAGESTTGTAASELLLLGAASLAIHQRRVSIRDLLGCGALWDTPGWLGLLDYVRRGDFRADLVRYETVPL